MKEKEKYVVILYILFILLSVCSVFFATGKIEKYAFTDSIRISDEWFYDSVRSNKLVSFDEFLERYPTEAGTEYTIVGKLPEEMKGSEAIYFYTRNAITDVYIEDELIYSLRPGEKERNTGRIGNLVPLPEGAGGKNIVIKFTINEDFRLEMISAVYFGSEGDLLRHVMCAKIISVVYSLLSLFIAVIQLGAGVLLRKNKEDAKKLFYLGGFSLAVCLWMFGSSNIVELLSDYRLNGQNMRYYALSLMAYPIYMFFFHDLKLKENWLDKLLHFGSLCNFMLVLLLKAFHIMDLEQSAMFTHCMLILVCGRVCWESLSSWKKANNKSTFSGILLFVGVITISALLLVDMFHYYFAYGDSWIKVSPFGYFVLIAVLTYRSLESAIHMMNLGKEAETVQHLAYFDILTGVGNRTALNEAMEQLEAHKEKAGNFGIVQFDVNGLKEVNDNLGHLAGDRLLKAAARVIKEGFEGYGECYRYGGDEFVVIIEGNAKAKYALGIQNMENLIIKNNKNCAKEEKVSIAYGIAYYEENRNLTTWQLQELADEQMYRRKRKMKAAMGK